ncbi:MAG: hypothetical protein IPF99_18390 [Deltaproteobacteria bacterium]|jgi:hypothetical protein|nr:hypothetical protein [Deltaproteobacteria bacterium]MBP6829837.1 hypothetical protein [Deltaproteobacteria bacterium]
MTRAKKAPQAIVHPPYDPADMPRLLAATRDVIDHPGPTDGAWWFGVSCWGELLIPGWTSDNAYSTAEVEVHGDTLCVGIVLKGAWMVVEIDRPVGFDPRRVTLLDAAEVRRYWPGRWQPDRRWASAEVTVFHRKPGFARAI